MSKDTEVQQLIINKLTKEQYNSIEEKSLTEIYDITDDAHFTESEISSLLETKQNKLIAGNNISFSGDTISATDTKYTAGNGINISEDNVISSTQNSAEWGNITGTLTEQTDLQEALDTKVNKEVGKSLISDTEIERLATLENYNDTEVKSNISELQSSVTSLQETKQDKLTAGSGIQISDNTISATISSINWGNIEGDINSQTDLKSKLDTKVDKQEGKSLISDTEIERLASVKNYDDTEIKDDISELQSSKQDKLTAGENISISGNTISNKIKPDTKTIVQNEDGTLTSIGNKTKSDTIKIDWIGTKEEYDSGISDGTIQSDWFCHITDDEQTVDYSLYAIKTEVQDSLNNKANTDLDNLTDVGKKHFLNKNKISNCVLEAPMNIDYLLSDNTLTIKAGSILTVPYGTIDKSDEFPVGSTFLNNNYKVISTEFISNRFFVNVQLQEDISQGGSTTDSSNRSLAIDITNNNMLVFVNAESGTETNPDGGNVQYYNTDLNIVKWFADTIDKNSILSFPIMRISANGTFLYAKITEIFNTVGYIGSILFIRKGIKVLMANGRNSDGTLKNIEYTTPNTIIGTRNALGFDTKLMFLFSDGTTTDTVYDRFVIYQNYPENPVAGGLFYVTNDNKFYYKDTSGSVATWVGVNICEFVTDGNSTITTNITSMVPQLPISIAKQTDLDYLKDYVLPIGQPQITLTNTLRENEIWLEGAIVSRGTYSKLYAIYGTTYGQGDGSTTFQLPDFRNRTLWGSSSLGYVNAGLPNIVGEFKCDAGKSSSLKGTGAFSSTTFEIHGYQGGNAGDSEKLYNLKFDASKSNSIYGGSSTVQPPAIKVRVKTRYQ